MGVRLGSALGTVRKQDTLFGYFRESYLSGRGNKLRSDL